MSLDRTQESDLQRAIVITQKSGAICSEWWFLCGVVDQRVVVMHLMQNENLFFIFIFEINAFKYQKSTNRNTTKMQVSVQMCYFW